MRQFIHLIIVQFAEFKTFSREFDIISIAYQLSRHEFRCLTTQILKRRIDLPFIVSVWSSFNQCFDMFFQ